MMKLFSENESERTEGLKFTETSRQKVKSQVVICLVQTEKITERNKYKIKEKAKDGREEKLIYE